MDNKIRQEFEVTVSLNLFSIVISGAVIPELARRRRKSRPLMEVRDLTPPGRGPMREVAAPRAVGVSEAHPATGGWRWLLALFLEASSSCGVSEVWTVLLIAFSINSPVASPEVLKIAKHLFFFFLTKAQIRA